MQHSTAYRKIEVRPIEINHEVIYQTKWTPAINALLQHMSV